LGCNKQGTDLKILGIDLAWQSNKNTTAMAVGKHQDGELIITNVYPSVASLEDLLNSIEVHGDASGISIDAPLIIKNRTGQRVCEKELSKQYGSRKASCHTSNMNLYPDAPSSALSKYLEDKGYRHLGANGVERWQIECYPHPAIIEIFGLPERLLYKKGKMIEKRSGQCALANYLKELIASNIIRLAISDSVSKYLDTDRINELSGAKLKQNEDVLDSIICAYIGAMYSSDSPSITFGETSDGYIYVPTQKCI
jgi:predicted RNase H-like nuclease